ncbi:hypothetical protein HJ029_18465 [Vibrio parahaemolyticus]|nr:hypothetical protein [Vibrio parahaemolyticus]HCM1216833.1 SIR2 family protein [Vibrio parahaemolyticus]
MRDSMMKGLEKKLEEQEKPTLPYITVPAEHVLNRLLNSDTVFFTGAGFSKAWDASYPSGMALFSISNFAEYDDKYNFFKLADELHIEQPALDPSHDDYDSECYEYFKAIKFHLDIFRRYPSLMPSNLDKTEIEALECEIREFIKIRFEDMVGKTEFDVEDLTKSNPKMVRLFQYLLKSESKMSFVSTNYDYIIEKIFSPIQDLDFTRGVINKNVFENKRWCKNRIPLFKINGGFEIKKNHCGFFADYIDQSEAPQIILPSQEQIYDDKYFKSVFLKSAERLREANTLVFIGYSMPEEDHTIQFLLKHFHNKNPKDKNIYVISRNKESAEKPAKILASLFKSISENEGLYILDGDIESVSDAIDSLI